MKNYKFVKWNINLNLYKYIYIYIQNRAYVKSSSSVPPVGWFWCDIINYLDEAEYSLLGTNARRFIVLIKFIFKKKLETTTRKVKENKNYQTRDRSSEGLSNYVCLSAGAL